MTPTLAPLRAPCSCTKDKICRACRAWAGQPFAPRSTSPPPLLVLHDQLRQAAMATWLAAVPLAERAPDWRRQHDTVRQRIRRLRLALKGRGEGGE